MSAEHRLVEEVWENERFLPLQGWTSPFAHEDLDRFSDRRGRPLPGSQDPSGSHEHDDDDDDGSPADFPYVPCPPGWAWQNKWHVDLFWGVVDCNGWAYSTSFSALLEDIAANRTSAQEKTSSLSRRRRWTRARECVTDNARRASEHVLNIMQIERNKTQAVIRHKESGFTELTQFDKHRRMLIREYLAKMERKKNKLLRRMRLDMKELMLLKAFMADRASIELDYCRKLNSFVEKYEHRLDALGIQSSASQSLQRGGTTTHASPSRMTAAAARSGGAGADARAISDSSAFPLDERTQAQQQQQQQQQQEEEEEEEEEHQQQQQQAPPPTTTFGAMADVDAVDHAMLQQLGDSDLEKSDPWAVDSAPGTPRRGGGTGRAAAASLTPSPDRHSDQAGSAAAVAAASTPPDQSPDPLTSQPGDAEHARQSQELSQQRQLISQWQARMQQQLSDPDAELMHVMLQSYRQLSRLNMDFSDTLCGTVQSEVDMVVKEMKMAVDHIEAEVPQWRGRLQDVDERCRRTKRLLEESFQQVCAEGVARVMEITEQMLSTTNTAMVKPAKQAERPRDCWLIEQELKELLAQTDRAVYGYARFFSDALWRCSALRRRKAVAVALARKLILHEQKRVWDETYALLVQGFIGAIGTAYGGVGVGGTGARIDTTTAASPGTSMVANSSSTSSSRSSNNSLSGLWAAAAAATAGPEGADASSGGAKGGLSSFAPTAYDEIQRLRQVLIQGDAYEMPSNEKRDADGASADEDLASMTAPDGQSRSSGAVKGASSPDEDVDGAGVASEGPSVAELAASDRAQSLQAAMAKADSISPLGEIRIPVAPPSNFLALQTALRYCEQPDYFHDEVVGDHLHMQRWKDEDLSWRSVTAVLTFDSYLHLFDDAITTSPWYGHDPVETLDVYGAEAYPLQDAKNMFQLRVEPTRFRRLLSDRKPRFLCAALDPDVGVRWVHGLRDLSTLLDVSIGVGEHAGGGGRFRGFSDDSDDLESENTGIGAGERKAGSDEFDFDNDDDDDDADAAADDDDDDDDDDTEDGDTAADIADTADNGGDVAARATDVVDATGTGAGANAAAAPVDAPAPVVDDRSLAATEQPKDAGEKKSAAAAPTDDGGKDSADTDGTSGEGAAEAGTPAGTPAGGIDVSSVSKEVWEDL